MFDKEHADDYYIMADGDNPMYPSILECVKACKELSAADPGKWYGVTPILSAEGDRITGYIATETTAAPKDNPWMLSAFQNGKETELPAYTRKG